MGLTYYYKFEAPAETPADRLEAFLRSVETRIRPLKFRQSLMVNAVFDSPERRAFARRLVSGFPVGDERLKTAALPLKTPVWDYSQSEGIARLLPLAGVFLVVADEHHCETCFGFFRYPEVVTDQRDYVVAESGLGGKWFFQDWVKTPDPRFRLVVQEFSRGGYLTEEKDDYRHS
jgi:hypothetical protein